MVGPQYSAQCAAAADMPGTVSQKGREEKEGMQKRRGKTRPKQNKAKKIKQTRNKEAGKGGALLRALYSTHLEQIVPDLLDFWNKGEQMGLGYGSVGKVQL